MKIFDGFEEIEILPWYECKDCDKHLHFSGRSSALFFLQRFKTLEMAMDCLRRLIRERGHGLGLAVSSNEHVLDGVAHMLATGELHATRNLVILGGAPTGKSTGGPPPVQPLPGPPRRPTADPPPEEPLFLPNVDPVAIAQVLTHAALTGVPFCAE